MLEMDAEKTEEIFLFTVILQIVDFHLAIFDRF